MAKRKKQVKRPPIPAHHHVGRHCPFPLIDFDPVTCAPRGVFPALFELKMKRGAMESYLSMNCFEAFPGPLTAQYQGVVQALRGKRTVSAGSAIARLKVGSILAAGTPHGCSLVVKDHSGKVDASYVGLEGLPKDNGIPALLVMLSNACIKVRQVREIDGVGSGVVWAD